MNGFSKTDFIQNFRMKKATFNSSCFTLSIAVAVVPQ